MIQKLFWSLLALLSSLVAVLGVVRWEWTWEMFVPGVATIAFLTVAAACDSRSGWTRLEEESDQKNLDDEATPTALPTFRQHRHTTRLEWGESAPQLSCSGPTEF